MRLQNIFGARAFQLAVCLSVGAVLSITMGQDANWDLRNYHLYTPYSVWSGRFDRDFLAADFQTLLNPTLDFFYAALALGPLAAYPRLLAAVMGFWFGGLAFLVLRLSLGFFKSRVFFERALFVGASVLLSVTGVAVFSQIGNTTNDIASGVILLMGLACLLKSVNGRADHALPHLQSLLGGGFLFGLAAGCKLSMLPYSPAIAVALLTVLPFAVWVPAMLLFSSAWMLGFIPAFGWWGWMLWERFSSPVFPFFNDVFLSPDAPARSIHDLRFMPRSWLQWVFYPFFWAWRADPMVVVEEPVRDPRMAIGYLSLLSLLPAYLADRLRRGKRKPADGGGFPAGLSAFFPDEERLLLSFLAFGYFAWLCSSSIIRYAAPVEVCAGLGCLIVVWRLTHRFIPRYAVQTACLGAVIVPVVAISMTQLMIWPRVPFGDHVFEVDMAWAPRDALFVSVIGPVAYLAAFTPLEANTRFIGFGWVSIAGQGYPMGARLEQDIAETRGPIYVLYTDEMTFLLAKLPEVGLSSDLGPCRVVASNLDVPLGKPVHACLTHRLSDGSHGERERRQTGVNH